MKGRATAKERILDAAETLLLSRGFEATSLDEVCAAAATTKGGLFYHFDSKETLAAEAVRRFFANLVDEGRRAAEGAAPAGPVEALFTYVDGVLGLLSSPALRNGCLLGAMAVQTPNTHPTVAGAAREALDMWKQGIVQTIDAAAQQRCVVVDADELADAFLAAVEGGLVLDKHRPDNPATRSAVRHFASYLRSILEPKGAS